MVAIGLHHHQEDVHRATQEEDMVVASLGVILCDQAVPVPVLPPDRGQGRVLRLIQAFPSTLAAEVVLGRLAGVAEVTLGAKVEMTFETVDLVLLLLEYSSAISCTFT